MVYFPFPQTQPNKKPFCCSERMGHSGIFPGYKTTAVCWQLRHSAELEVALKFHVSKTYHRASHWQRSGEGLPEGHGCQDPKCDESVSTMNLKTALLRCGAASLLGLFCTTLVLMCLCLIHNMKYLDAKRTPCKCFAMSFKNKPWKAASV